MQQGSPLLPIFSELSCSLDRHPSAAQCHFSTPSIQPNLCLPRTRSPLISAINTVLAIRYSSIHPTCPNLLNLQTSVLSKVFECTLDNVVLPTTQFADRKGLGTCNAPLCVFHTLQSALESGQYSRIEQIDYSAAFDRVEGRFKV